MRRPAEPDALAFPPLEGRRRWRRWRGRHYGLRARMFTPSTSYLFAFRSPLAPVNGLPRHAMSISTNPACLMLSMYSPSRRAPPIQAVQMAMSSRPAGGMSL